jgi:hypothetical protein
MILKSVRLQFSLYHAAKADGFGSCHCFGVAVGGVAMTSAKSVGENLFRLPCGGNC